MKNEISECKTCGAEIVWMKTRKDKNIPVDLPDPDDTRADKDNREETLSATLFNRERMVTHFVTCVHAAQHRSPRAGSTQHAATPTATSGDVSLNSKRLNTALAVLQDIASKPADGLRAVELAKVGLSQIREIR